MVLPAKRGPGPLGNGGHWKCLRSEEHDQFGALAIDLVVQSTYSK